MRRKILLWENLIKINDQESTCLHMWWCPQNVKWPPRKRHLSKSFQKSFQESRWLGFWQTGKQTMRTAACCTGWLKQSISHKSPCPMACREQRAARSQSWGRSGNLLLVFSLLGPNHMPKRNRAGIQSLPAAWAASALLPHSCKFTGPFEMLVEQYIGTRK